MTKKDAIEAFGSVPALAKALDIAPAAIYQWKDGPIPELRAYQIRDILSGKRRPAKR